MIVNVRAVPEDDLIPTANWVVGDNFETIDFKLRLDLPKGGIFQKSLFVSITLTIDDESVPFVEEIEFGNSYDLTYEVPISSEKRLYILQGVGFFYTVSIVAVPTYAGIAIAGSTRFIEYTGIIQ